jgi:DNA/RNA-binding domain of Phe-tRNA-synthetase-like protein
MTTTYTLHPEIFERWPGYCRGVVWVTGARNGAPSSSVTAQLRQAEEQARRTIVGNVAEHPRIAAWREAYRRFGAKPSEHRSAIEALLRRVLRPDALAAINLLVDIGMLVSVRHLLPAGVHPIPAGDLDLRLAREGDVFAPPGGEPAETLPPGEVVFATGAQVLTRRWTWRQAAATQTLPATTSVFFNLDGLPPVTPREVRAAMEDVQALVREHAGGTVEAVLLDAQRPSVTFA